MKDTFGRTIDYLRISVTDRCNERCVYCMPECGINSLCHKDILSYEEIAFIAKVFACKGIKTVRLTGGDPLVRKNLSELIALLKKSTGIEKVFLTTNGIALDAQLDSLIDAGIDGINMSLDALSSGVYAKITRRPEDAHDVQKILAVLDRLCDVRKKNPTFAVKLNCVLSGLNNGELVPVARLAKDRDISVRFIELMPIGQGLLLSKNFLSQDTVLPLFKKAFGTLTPCAGSRYNYFKPADFMGNIGFISPVSHKFCSTCSRLRITADGFLKACLQYDEGVPLKPLFADGFSAKAESNLQEAFDAVVRCKPKQNHFYESNPADTQNLPAEKRSMNQIGG